MVFVIFQFLSTASFEVSILIYFFLQIIIRIKIIIQNTVPFEFTQGKLILFINLTIGAVLG